MKFALAAVCLLWIAVRLDRAADRAEEREWRDLP